MRRRTRGVDDAVRPGGVPERFKALRDVLHGRRLALYAVQQRLNLWATATLPRNLTKLPMFPQ